MDPVPACGTQKSLKPCRSAPGLAGDGPNVLNETLEIPYARIRRLRRNLPPMAKLFLLVLVGGIAVAAYNYGGIKDTVRDAVKGSVRDGV